MKADKFNKTMATQKSNVDTAIQKADRDQSVLLLLTGDGKGKTTSGFGTIFRAPDDQKQNFTVDIIRSSFEKRIGVVAKQLERGPYMAGDAFTLADISVGYGVILAQIEAFGLAPMIPEIVNDYARRLMGRAGYQRMTQVK